MLAQLRNALLIIHHPVAQSRPEDLLQLGEALISHGLRKAHERRRLNIGLLGNTGHRAESDLVGMVEDESGDLVQPLRQRLPRSMMRALRVGKSASTDSTSVIASPRPQLTMNRLTTSRKNGMNIPRIRKTYKPFHSSSGRESGVTDREPLLEAKGVYKYFGAITALRDVNFHVNAGEVLGVVGDNGAGKSTLMKILSGLYPPSEGELVFAGRPVHFTSPRDARNMGIEMVYQDFALAGNMPIFENIYLGREPGRDIGGLDASSITQQIARDGADASRQAQDPGEERRPERRGAVGRPAPGGRHRARHRIRRQAS